MKSNKLKTVRNFDWLQYVKLLIFLSALIIFWQVLVSTGRWPEFLFPGPGSVFEAVKAGFVDGSILNAIVASMKRILIGFGISILVGTTIGFMIGRFKIVDETLGVLVLGLQTLPSICWLPIAILWFGLNESAVIFVIIMGALLSITIATTDGVRNIPPIYLRASRMMGADGWRLYADVLVPATLPAIVTGIKLGWSFAWRSLMAGELLFAAGGGLGFLLQTGRELNDISQVMAVMLVIIAIGLLFDRLVFARLEHAVRRRWGLID